MEILFVAFIVFFIALLFSLIGLGGALMYTPVLFWFGMPLLEAIPIALLLNAVTTTSASYIYLKKGWVDTKTAVPLTIAAAAGAPLGAYLANRVVSEIILASFAFVLVLASLRILFFSDVGIKMPVQRISGDKHVVNFLFILIGFIIGSLSAFIGIGGGTFLVPLLMIMGIKPKIAAPTSSFIVAFLSLSGFIAYLLVNDFGKFDVPLILAVSICAFAGAQIGSRIIFERISQGLLAKMLGIIFLLIALKIINDIILLY